MYEVSVYFLIFRLSSRGLKADGAMPGMLYVTGVLQNPADRWYLCKEGKFIADYVLFYTLFLLGEQVLKLVENFLKLS